MNRIFVVCVKDGWRTVRSTPEQHGTSYSAPIVDEIYEVIHIYEWNGRVYYILKEIPEAGFIATAFRPVDPIFGELVCEILEQQIALEKVISI